jgi:hypothetical protein
MACLLNKLWGAMAALALLLGAVPVLAEPAPQSFPIEKPPFECRNFRGLKVVVQQASGLGDVARAQIVGRIPFIQVDPERLMTLPPKLQIFFFGHECAHHVLGHNFYPTPSVETDADCWSIKRGRELGLFKRDDIEAFAPYFAHSKGSNAGHLPGPERVTRLLQCYDEPGEFAATQ